MATCSRNSNITMSCFASGKRMAKLVQLLMFPWRDIALHWLLYYHRLWLLSVHAYVLIMLYVARYYKYALKGEVCLYRYTSTPITDHMTYSQSNSDARYIKQD